MGNSKLKLLYDGTCVVCHKEISYYKKYDKNNILKLVDISSQEFKAQDYSLTEVEVNKFFHVIDETGNILVGVEAFVKIWRELEGFESWYKVGGSKIARPFLNLGYFFFIHIRPYLPKRQDCST